MSLKRKSTSDAERAPKTKSLGKFRRSGKWSNEEEALALQLIVEFENGTLPVSECSKGCTLRSFLSRRLSCAPMRISKKFAKKQIGKLMYTPKISDEEPDYSLLRHLEAVYFSSDPFNHEEANDYGDKLIFTHQTDNETHSEGSISSDCEEGCSIETFNSKESSHSGDFSTEADDMLSSSDNEAEEWKEVLSYYFSQSACELKQQVMF